MKKILLLLCMSAMVLFGHAQISRMVYVTEAGTISTQLNTIDKATVTDLTVSGVIDARDFKFLRDSMTLMSVLILDNVRITAYTGIDGTYNTGNMTHFAADEIPQNAFYNNKTIKIILLPNSVTSIGIGAFSNCSSLTSIGIPSSVTTIGSSAFYFCSGLTSIMIPNSVISIGGYAFSGTAWYAKQPNGLIYAGKVAYAYKGTMPANTSISLNEGTTGIAGLAFSGCSGLTSITIPNSVTSMGDKVFQSCSSLTSITIPSSVTSIGSSAFSGCSGLTSITIPNSVTSIGSSAFSNCSNLTSITIPNSVTLIGNSAFYSCSKLTSINLSSSVISIGSFAFSWCIGLTSITIPNSITTIGDGVFQFCSGLTSISIPSSVTSIGTAVFSGCSKLTAINVDTNNPTFSGLDGMVYNKKQTKILICPVAKMGSFIIPSSVDSIGNYAFQSCVGLTGITIPNSVTSIGNYAFQSCIGLTAVEFQDNSVLKSIGSNVLSGCSKLANFTIPASVSTIDNSAFYGYSGIVNLDANHPIYTLLNGILYDKEITTLFQCIQSTNGSLEIPSSISSIKNKAFFNSNITGIKLSESLQSIGDYAFDSCFYLTRIVLPSSITSIGNSVFKMSAIKSIVSNASNPFSLGSDNVTNNCILYVPIGSKNLYQSATNWKGFSIIVELSSKSVNVTTPGKLSSYFTTNEKTSITSLTLSGTIDARDFKYIRDSLSVLNGVDMSNVTISAYTGTAGPYSTSSTIYAASEIPSNSFNNKPIITNIILPSSITSIGSSAFNNCSNLSSISIPGSVTSIGAGTFYYCSNLTSINIPNSVTYIGSNAFAGTAWYNNQPAGLVYAGKVAYSYKGIMSAGTSIKLNEGTTGITEYIFQKNRNLTSITIPSSVTSIGSYAFSDCLLTSISAYSSIPVDLIKSTNALNVNKTTCTLYVPIGSKAAYQAANQWKDFTNIIEMTTAVPELNKLNLSLSPNPANGIIEIKGLESSANVSIYNLQGRELITRTIIPNEAISINSLPRGLYIVKVNNREGSFETKFLN
ncbi:MAG: leucine-rich repeat domain-containing protein [Paludibacter sp.]